MTSDYILDRKRIGSVSRGDCSEFLSRIFYARTCGGDVRVSLPPR